MKLREIGFLSTSKHSDRSEPGEGALDDMQSWSSGQRADGPRHRRLSSFERSQNLEAVSLYTSSGIWQLIRTPYLRPERFEEEEKIIKKNWFTPSIKEQNAEVDLPRAIQIRNEGKTTRKRQDYINNTEKSVRRVGGAKKMNAGWTIRIDITEIEREIAGGTGKSQRMNVGRGRLTGSPLLWSPGGIPGCPSLWSSWRRPSPRKPWIRRRASLGDAVGESGGGEIVAGRSFSYKPIKVLNIQKTLHKSMCAKASKQWGSSEKYVSTKRNWAIWSTKTQA